MPAFALPEMTFRSAADVPPIIVPTAPLISMPFRFGRIAAPTLLIDRSSKEYDGPAPVPETLNRTKSKPSVEAKTNACWSSMKSE